MPDQFSPEPEHKQFERTSEATKRSGSSAPLHKRPASARFPVAFYVVHHLPSNSYGSAVVGRTRGLACFTKPEFALAFAKTMETENNLIVEIFLEDASAIASASTPRSGALILADSLETPVVFRLKGRHRHI
jgi:hypothetical protein